MEQGQRLKEEKPEIALKSYLLHRLDCFRLDVEKWDDSDGTNALIEYAHSRLKNGGYADPKSIANFTEFLFFKSIEMEKRIAPKDLPILAKLFIFGVGQPDHNEWLKGCRHYAKMQGIILPELDIS